MWPICQLLAYTLLVVDEKISVGLNVLISYLYFILKFFFIDYVLLQNCFLF